MLYKTKFRYVTAILFAVLSLLFLVFGIYMLAAERNDINEARFDFTYTTPADISAEEISDSSAPCGIRQKYSFTLDSIDEGDVSLMFYTVHQNIEVQIDGEEVYSHKAFEKGIGSSPSSNWTIVPLYKSDSGKQITITVTPVYSSSINRAMEFYVGSSLKILDETFNRDLPQIILSALCAFMGMLLIIVQGLLIIGKKAYSWDNFYLGCFAILMGIWRMTDTRFSSLMFEEFAKGMGYITLFSLFVIPVPLLLYIDELHDGKQRYIMRGSAAVTSVIALIAIILQLTNVIDLRRILIICHIVLVIDILIAVCSVIFHVPKNNRERNARLFVLVLGGGGVLDLVYYYLAGSSSGMLITLIAFLVCAIYAFIINVFEIGRKIYIDDKTKLNNKARWDEYVEVNISDNEVIGIMMLDLNNLKHTNDTLGHEVGDKIITDFAGILRDTMGGSEALFRWGGDEFVVLVRNANRDKLDVYVSKIRRAVERYNKQSEAVKIHYACGFALSSDYPSLTTRELLTKADEEMYRDKDYWHKQNETYI